MTRFAGKSRLGRSAIAAALAFSMLSSEVAQAAEGFVEPLKSGGEVKLYDAPNGQKSVGTAGPPNLPLQVQGAARNGFYPVRVGDKQYWVDGMEVKMHRDNRAQCNAGASVHAAGQLGAATNRCQ
jgi:hypothetical protein